MGNEPSIEIRASSGSINQISAREKVRREKMQNFLNVFPIIKRIADEVRERERMLIETSNQNMIEKKIIKNLCYDKSLSVPSGYL